MPLFLAMSAPTDAEARREALTHYGMARWLEAKQQLVSATEQLEAARKLDPAALAPKRDLVRLYADLGKDTAAIRLANEVLAADPEDIVTARTLARLHLAAKQFREAAAVITAVIAAANPVKEPAIRLALFREQARAFQLLKDWPKARQALQNALEYLESHQTQLLRDGFDREDLPLEQAAILEKLGTASLECGLHAEAITAFTAAAAIFQSREPHAAARLHWNLSFAYEAAKEPAKAVAACEQFLARKPQAVGPYERYAKLLRQAGRAREIEPLLQAQIQQQPKNAAIEWVLTAEQARDDFPTAHLRFKSLLLTTREESFFELLVKTHGEQKRSRELLAIAEDLFPISPEKRKVESTAVQSDRQQAFASALARHTEFAVPLLQATRGRNYSPQLWELLGWLAEKAEQPKELERTLKEALRTAGDDPSFTAFERLAEHYQRHRRWSELIDLCERIPVFEAYRAILSSQALAELGRGEEALAQLKSQKLASFAVRRQTAFVLGLLGRHAEMLQTLDAMLDEYKTPDEVRRIRTLRADAFLGLNRFDDMEAEYRGLLDEDPDDVLILNNLGYNLADKNRKLPEAEALIRRAMEVDRQARSKAGDVQLVNAAYLDSLGWVLCRRGQLKEARATLEQASELAEGRVDAIVWDHLGDVCFRSGDRVAAKAAWLRAKACYGSDHRGLQHGRAEELKKKLLLAD